MNYIAAPGIKKWTVQIRVCDLKEGDEFEMFNTTYRVTKVSKTGIEYKNTSNVNAIKGWYHFGVKSQQFVNKKNPDDNR